MGQRSDLVGQQFGSYQLLRLIGMGSFAEVYLGEHIHLETQAAIKVLHTQLARTDIETFRREARIIARLRHPNIVRVLDFNVKDATPFLVMDYAVGGTMLERYPRGTIVPLPTIVSYAQQIADALQYAHDEKLIHRDVKPENILLDERNNAFLSDFGIALTAQSSLYQNIQNITGTAAYMSPEQIQGRPRPASDQYSLGIVIYEWLSGIWPFEGSLTEIWSQHMFAPLPPLCEKVPGISPEVEYVVMTALHKDPKRRFGNVRAFATALQQASQVGQLQTVIYPRLQTRPLSSIGQPQPTVPPCPPTNTIPLARLSSSHIRLQGCLNWSFRSGGAVHSSPTVTNSMVYFGSDDGYCYALDVASGQLKWAFLTGKAVYSSPAVVNGMVYFGSHDRKFYALDAARGQQKWSFRSGGAIYSSPTVVDGVIYFGSDDGKLYALDAGSGQLRWSFRASPLLLGWVRSSPTVVNNVVYFGSYNHYFYALNAGSGQKLWSFRSDDWVDSSPTVVDGLVYFGSDDHNFYALDAKSGRKLWSFRTGDWVDSSPTVVNGVVYFGSDDHNLYALDAACGQKLWSFPTGGAISSMPRVVNDTVYCGSHDHRLYALDTSSGKQKWSFQAGGKIHSSITVVDGIVYVGSDDGKLYAIFV